MAVRTCVGCRTRAEASTLLRVVARGGAVLADSSATLTGRGAWVHPTAQCVELAAKRRAFGRALRVSTELRIDALLHTVGADQASSKEQAD